MTTTSTRIGSRRHRRDMTFDPQRCSATGKLRYRDKREATKALHFAVARRCMAEAAGLVSTRRERRAYFCDACAGFHLTSQEAR